jgi:hypothetical protein
MIYLILAQISPQTDNIWQFLGWLVGLIYLVYISEQNRKQLRQGKKIEEQTNGLISKTVSAAEEAAHARGELVGAAKEQARIAKKLALSDEAAKRLAEVKSNDHG